jgi:hypothetical protein
MNNEIISEIAGLRMELQEIIESFQKKKRDLLILSNEKLPMEERIKEIELTIAYEVSVESDESGKKAYPNDTLRNAEVRKRLKSSFEYESLKEQLDFLEKQERTLKTEIDILDRKFRIVEQMVALVMVEGHILAHYKEVVDYERSN